MLAATTLTMVDRLGVSVVADGFVIDPPDAVVVVRAAGPPVAREGAGEDLGASGCRRW